MTKSKAIIFVLAIALIIIVSPVAIYTASFGFHLSPNHERWAEFGAFLQGIYSPLFAILTILVLSAQAVLLLRQNKIQEMQTIIQNQVSKLQHDQSFLRDAREDVIFYVDVALKGLETPFTDTKSYMDEVKNWFSNLDKVQLDTPLIKQVADNLHHNNQRPIDAWVAIYPIMTALKSQDDQFYQKAYERFRQYMITRLSMEACVAMDKYYCSWSSDQIKGDYIFWGSS